jgi:membrane AbrB-like protein
VVHRQARLIVAARALAIALIGGGLATLAGVPASWLMGAMILAGAASVAGLDTRLPQPVISIAMVLIGITLGAGATPEIVARAASWPLSLLVLGASIVAVQMTVQRFLTGVAGWDRSTAFFAAVPGALTYVLMAAMGTGADLRKIAVGQSVRIFLLVAVLPTVISAVEPSQPVLMPPVIAGYGALAVLLAAGAAGGALFQVLKVPAGLLCGSLAASAVLHATGLVTGTLPTPAIIAVFVTLGAFVGSRFVGTTIALLSEIAVAALGAFLIAIGVASIFAAISAAITGVDLPQVLVAFAPGGLDSMTSLALALHMDLAFVSVHQLARFIAVAVATPLFARRAIKDNV